ncbi:MAG: hypothetical protein ABW060_07250 [Solirubrobacteraceae bacterium]
MRRALVVLQVLAIVVLGAATVARFHVWADVDERPHFDYVQAVAEDGRLPELTDLVSPEVQAITDRTWPEPSPVDPAIRGLAGRSYEAFQPPLYYLVAAPAFLVEADHLRKVKVLRAFDLLLVLAAVALLWRLSGALRPADRLLAFSAGLVVVLWPGVLVRGITVSNAALELPLVTALLLVTWRLGTEPRRGTRVLAGVLLGACLLTKSTLISLAPLVLLVGAVDWRRHRDGVGTGLLVALPAALLAPWLAFNVAHYDALTPAAAAREQQRPFVNPDDVQYGVGDAVERTGRMLDQILPVEFLGQLDVAWVRVATALVVAALVVPAVVLAITSPRRRVIWFFALPVLTGYAMLVLTLLSANWPSFNLRYLYPVLPALAVAVAVAVPRGRERLAWGVVTGSSVLLAAVWFDMAGAFYFTDVGEKLGI